MIGGDWAKAGQELGKAGQEIGKATGKAVDAAQTAGGFFGKYLAGPLEEVSLIVTERLRFRRLAQAIRFEQKTRDLIKAADIGDAIRPIPLSFGVPLIEAATLEENDDLQTVWAQLLVNAATTVAPEPRTAFIGMLKEMSPLDAQILSSIYAASEQYRDDGGYVLTGGLPHTYHPHVEPSDRPDLSPAALVSLGNLERLGCVQPQQLFSGPTVWEVRLTPLGTEFVRAVMPTA